MDAAELLSEFQDRHIDHLVYEGPYRLTTWAQLERDLASILQLFADWRQRIYRFENQLGASVVLYQPLTEARMRWDLIVTEFVGDYAFAFRYAEGVTRNLPWKRVQHILDSIKAR